MAEQLRRAREAQGLSLAELAELTKIRSDHLEALENADYEPFSAPVYIRGSVRTCAAVLKLDVPAIVAALDAELAESPEFGSPPSLSGARRGPLDWVTYQLSRVNWRVVAVIAAAGLVVALLVYGWRLWNHRLKTDPLSAVGPGMYQPANAAEGDLLPVPTNAPGPRAGR